MEDTIKLFITEMVLSSSGIYIFWIGKSLRIRKCKHNVRLALNRDILAVDHLRAPIHDGDSLQDHHHCSHEFPPSCCSRLSFDSRNTEGIQKYCCVTLS